MFRRNPPIHPLGQDNTKAPTPTCLVYPSQLHLYSFFLLPLTTYLHLNSSQLPHHKSSDHIRFPVATLVPSCQSTRPNLILASSQACRRSTTNTYNGWCYLIWSFCPIVHTSYGRWHSVQYLPTGTGWLYPLQRPDQHQLRSTAWRVNGTFHSTLVTHQSWEASNCNLHLQCFGIAPELHPQCHPVCLLHRAVRRGIRVLCPRLLQSYDVGLRYIGGRDRPYNHPPRMCRDIPGTSNACGLCHSPKHSPWGDNYLHHFDCIVSNRLSPSSLYPERQSHCLYGKWCLPPLA